MSRSKADLFRNREALSRAASRTALFGTDEDSEFLSLNLDQVHPRPEQVREYFDDEALQELAASIAQHGVFQPIIVREVRPDHFQIIAGERRWRASKIAGKAQIPALSIKTDDPDLIAFLENVQRADLGAFEVAKGLSRLIQNKEGNHEKLSHEQLGHIVGKSQTYVTRALKILDLPQRIIDEYPENRHVPITMLMEIASMGGENAQIDLWERAKAGLSVAAARKVKQGRAVDGAAADPVAKAIRSTARITATLGTLRTSGAKLDEQQREYLQRLRNEIDSILEQ